VPSPWLAPEGLEAVRLRRCSTALLPQALNNPIPPLSRCPNPVSPALIAAHALLLGLARPGGPTLPWAFSLVGELRQRDSFLCATRGKVIVERNDAQAALISGRSVTTLFRETSTLPGVRYATFAWRPDPSGAMNFTCGASCRCMDSVPAHDQSGALWAPLPDRTCGFFARGPWACVFAMVFLVCPLERAAGTTPVVEGGAGPGGPPQTDSQGRKRTLL